MKNLFKIMMIVYIGVLVTGCASTKPSIYSFVDHPSELPLVQLLSSGEEPDGPIKIAMPPAAYGTRSTEEQRLLGERLRQFVISSFSLCPSRYVIVEDWQEADFVFEVPVLYLGRSKKRAYQGAVPSSAMRILANRPAEELARVIARQATGQAMRTGASASIAGLLFMAYDAGALVVDGVQAIGHLYCKVEVKFMDTTQYSANLKGSKILIFDTVLATTIDLDTENRSSDVDTAIPDITDPFLPLFIDYRCDGVEIDPADFIEGVTAEVSYD